MSINTIRESTIKKSKKGVFKGGIAEKKALGKEIGSRGISQRELDKKLKATDYDPTRRKKIMEAIVPKLTKPTKPKRNKRRLINRVKDTGALDKAVLNRTNTSALGSVGNKAGSFANSPKTNLTPGINPTQPGISSPPLSAPPKPIPGGQRPIGF